MRVSGHVSSLFLRPDDFLEILRELQNKVNLIYSPNEQYLPYFYEFSQVSVRTTTGGNIIIFVRLPVGSDNTPFTLYGLTPLWVQGKEGWARKVVLHEKEVIISNDGRSIGFLNTAKSCKKLGGKYICISDRSFEVGSHTNCILDLYNNGSSHLRQCEFKYARNIDTKIVQLGGSYVTSAGKEVKTTLLCQGQSSTVKIEPGINMLNVRPGCSLSGEGFKLQTTMYTRRQKMTVRMSFTNISIPPTKLRALNKTWEALKLPEATTYSEDMMAYLGKTEHIHVDRSMTDLHLILLITGVGLVAVAISLFIHRVYGCRQPCHRVLPGSHEPAREEQGEGESSNSESNPGAVAYEGGSANIGNNPRSRVVPPTHQQRTKQCKRRN